MVSIVLIGINSSETAISEVLNGLSSVADTEIILVAKSRPLGSSVTYKFLPTGTSSPSTCIAVAAEMATHENILFVDTRVTITNSTLADLISSLDKSRTVTLFNTDIGSETVEMPEVSSEALMHSLAQNSFMPMACVSVLASRLPRGEMPEGETIAEVLSNLVVSVLGDNHGDIGDLTISAPLDTCSLDLKARARTLKHLINISNIEDLFPQHEWGRHSKESAAAAYHTMAATFLRLGESDSAINCLRLSDQLEDSPRSLALKGLIALERGEILGAVANMVSSLQQYEIRKKENDSHYSQFQPKNLEVINEKLNAGLQALNRRDNETAVSHFAEAVFQFDSFYQECGLERHRA